MTACWKTKQQMGNQQTFGATEEQNPALLVLTFAQKTETVAGSCRSSELGLKTCKETMWKRLDDGGEGERVGQIGRNMRWIVEQFLVLCILLYRLSR
jgi:hypothetical protein